MSEQREPVYGDWMRGIYASEKNPIRDGMYVETIHRGRGRINPGKHFRLTNGAGKFWMYPADSVIFINKGEPDEEAR